MRIWLVTVGEPLPSDGADRLFRTGILADHMANKGHNVVFWSASFDHVRKRQRVGKNTTIVLSPNYQLKLLFAPGYRKNISFARHRNHQEVARQFRAEARRTPLPDVILCSLPTLELCSEAVEFGELNGIPVVLDIRDLWPDVAIDCLPTRFRALGNILFRSMRNSARRSCARATAITGVTDGYVNWGTSQAGRQSGPYDRSFPMAYVERRPGREETDAAMRFWRQHGISEDTAVFTACFFGTIGRHFEIAPLIHAAKRLASTGRRIKWVICGTGEDLETYRRLARDCPDVIFPGWMNAAQIWALMKLSRVGLTPYVSSPNFTPNLPNKPIEYLSAGLPIISSLQGVLADLLREHDCGITYANESVDGIVDAFLQLYDSPDRLNAMSRNALDLYRRRFVAEEVYSNMTAYLQAIAHDSPAAKAA